MFAINHVAKCLRGRGNMSTVHLQHGTTSHLSSPPPKKKTEGEEGKEWTPTDTIVYIYGGAPALYFLLFFHGIICSCMAGT